ncbi:hypothetical protein AUC31_01925 [Planococcus rifietoensis]|uniref:Uncharacterized protein n=1 Tax=Planococcus rifietoensis TaxID=200991 RepID=A0A0U2Q694_9BACL|nr:hypothetical protein [Planococcus rifietoensis]ALS74086.1 hypothetical protein AUC31_01925 [Planococcus rifietoensis]
MSKTVKLIISLVIVGLIFLGGFFVGNISKAEIMKEIKIGYEDVENSSKVIYEKVFTDVENSTTIDNFIMIYLNAKEIENPNIDLENPDMYIVLNNPNASVGLIDSKVWFVDDGAIIGKRAGESWDQIDFYKTDESDVEYIKETVEYEGK